MRGFMKVSDRRLLRAYVGIQKQLMDDIHILQDEIDFLAKKKDMKFSFGLIIIIYLALLFFWQSGIYFVLPFIFLWMIYTGNIFFMAKNKNERREFVGTRADGKLGITENCSRMARRHFNINFLWQELGEMLEEERKLREGDNDILFDPYLNLLKERNKQNLSKVIIDKGKYLEGLTKVVNNIYGEEVWGEDIYQACLLDLTENEGVKILKADE